MTEKAALRAEIREKIAALSREKLRESNAAIREKILALPALRAANRVFTYLSLDWEVDTRAVIEALLAWGKTVAVPVVRGKGVMTFAGFDGADMADPNVVLSPEPSDILLVPALCYDRQNYRLGQGGGYYDRYLAANPGCSIGLCRSVLLQDHVPVEAHDIAVDLVITD